MSNNRISTYLINAREIKKWMEERNTTKPPSTNSKDEEEKRLGVALHTIRIYYLNKYKKLPTEEERKMYKKKYPYFEEVKRIVDEIDRNNLPIKLIQAMKIKKWMEERKTIKPPVPSYLKDAEEKRLGLALNSIKQYLLKPYEQLETEEEREEYKRKHPEYEEVKQIVDEIDRNSLSQYLINAREIKKWMEEKNITNFPSKNSDDEEERRLAVALLNIRQQFLKPYQKLKTSLDRELYKKRYPYFNEVKEIID